MNLTTSKRLPPWFRQEIPGDEIYKMQRLFSEFAVRTVCQEAKCPNMTYCFGNKKVTFIILGDSCTRSCRFCNIGLGVSSRHCELPLVAKQSQNRDCVVAVAPRNDKVLPRDEPERLSKLVELLGLNYVVITSVTRDDLADGGAQEFAKTVELIHNNNGIKVEVLIPDFCGKIKSLECVLDSEPDTLGHNLETVSRLYSKLRPKADYARSLGLLSKAKELNPKIITKSSLMLGLGETKEEVIQAIEDLRESGCDILTLGQYLAPSPKHYPVKEFISLEEFKEYQELGISRGFKSVLSGPLVRSSFKAEELYQEIAYV